jgi:CoA:oxalate CoA-transferase
VSEDTARQGPFSGLRVIEFGRFIAAPYCGQLLADGGAEVVKVEPLSGDETRRNGEVIPSEGRQFVNKNRGKRSLAVDLSDLEVREAVHALVREADVVLCNFRPGQAEQLGLDYETLRHEHPRLIYAENTAFGRKGPMATRPGMDLMMTAYSGLVPTGPNGPVDIEAPVVDYTAGLLLAWGISTALYHRERTGEGQKVDVSLLHAAMLVQNNSMNHIDVIDGWRHDYLEYANGALADGAHWSEVVAAKRDMQPHAVNRAYYGFYQTKNGFIAVSAMGRGNQLNFLECLGVDDRWVTEPGWLPDDAREHARSVTSAVAEVFRTRTTAEWVSTLEAAGVPVAAVQLREALLDDEQAWEIGCFVRLEHELIGGLTVVAPPVHFSAAPLSTTTASPPLGAHTRDILAESGLDSARIEALRRRGVINVGSG